jgi:hypothetical protein
MPGPQPYLDCPFTGGIFYAAGRTCPAPTGQLTF